MCDWLAAPGNASRRARERESKLMGIGGDFASLHARGSQSQRGPSGRRVDAGTKRTVQSSRASETGARCSTILLAGGAWERRRRRRVRTRWLEAPRSTRAAGACLGICGKPDACLLCGLEKPDVGSMSIRAPRSHALSRLHSELEKHTQRPLYCSATCRSRRRPGKRPAEGAIDDVRDGGEDQSTNL